MPFCVEALSCCRAAVILLLMTFLSEKKKISVAGRAQDKKHEAGREQRGESTPIEAGKCWKLGGICQGWGSCSFLCGDKLYSAFYFICSGPVGIKCKAPGYEKKRYDDGDEFVYGSLFSARAKCLLRGNNEIKRRQTRLPVTLSAALLSFLTLECSIQA